MRDKVGRFLCIGISFLLTIIACNLPSSTLPPSSSPVIESSSTSALPQTMAVASPVVTASLTLPPSITNTSTLTVSPTPQNPLVTADSLCWGGPGKAYEVISTIRSGTRVVLLGRGIVDGWWVVKNPTYRDPCWLPATNLQIDPAMDLSGLRVYSVPPTPTP